jgi:hypothetical protein
MQVLLLPAPILEAKERADGHPTGSTRELNSLEAEIYFVDPAPEAALRVPRDTVNNARRIQA